MKSTLLLAALLAVSKAVPAPEITSVVLWNDIEPQIKAEASGTENKDSGDKPQSKDENEDVEDESGDSSETPASQSQTDDSQSQTDDSQSQNDDSKTDDSESKTDDSKTDEASSEPASSQDSESTQQDDSSTQQDDSSTSEESKNDKQTSPKPTGTRLFANDTAHVSINPNMPAGSIILNVPTSTANTYVKAGEYATFEWSFTNVIVYPTAVNVEAYCSANMQTYTIATNQSIDNTQAVWNTSDVLASADVGLMTAQYTLYIYDSNATATSISSAGFLTPLSYIFGVYLPQKYTPWAQSYTYINFGVMLHPPVLMAGILGALGLLFAGLMV